jgi:hypothetical protein
MFAEVELLRQQTWRIASLKVFQNTYKMVLIIILTVYKHRAILQFVRMYCHTKESVLSGKPKTEGRSVEK